MKYYLINDLLVLKVYSSFGKGLYIVTVNTKSGEILTFAGIMFEKYGQLVDLVGNCQNGFIAKIGTSEISSRHMLCKQKKKMNVGLSVEDGRFVSDFPINSNGAIILFNFKNETSMSK